MNLNEVEEVMVLQDDHDIKMVVVKGQHGGALLESLAPVWAVDDDYKLCKSNEGSIYNGNDGSIIHLSGSDTVVYFWERKGRAPAQEMSDNKPIVKLSPRDRELAIELALHNLSTDTMLRMMGDPSQEIKEALKQVWNAGYKHGRVCDGSMDCGQ